MRPLIQGAKKWEPHTSFRSRTEVDERVPSWPRDWDKEGLE